MRMRLPVFLAALAIVWLAPCRSAAQDGKLEQLERRVQHLEQTARSDDGFAAWAARYLYPGFGVMAIAAFCALWARSTGRDPWLWLAAGVVFHVFALIAIAIKHEDDKKKAAPPA